MSKFTDKNFRLPSGLVPNYEVASSKEYIEKKCALCGYFDYEFFVLNDRVYYFEKNMTAWVVQQGETMEMVLQNIVKRYCDRDSAVSQLQDFLCRFWEMGYSSVFNIYSHQIRNGFEYQIREEVLSHKVSYCDEDTEGAFYFNGKWYLIDEYVINPKRWDENKKAIESEPLMVKKSSLTDL